MCYCIVFALFYFEFEGNFEYMPSGACIWRGELSEGFLRYEFRGAYIWRGLFSGILRARETESHTKIIW